MRDKLAQHDNILKHLLDGNSITPLEALNFFGCFRLGARIFELKEAGYDIQMMLVSNGKKKFASYKLVTKEESNGQRMLI